ncbi:MAG: UvrD-helicase domain-containing protein [Patescibacteria group bacterium]|nr:UvrD-helicase domain-containing protein [Patescibacteria group bacterium]
MNSSLFDGLTPAQLEATTHFEGPLLVLAGPGSGKTRVVTHRVAWLLDKGVARHNILALTFTNKAAEEMQARIERLAPGERVWVSTFHRFCARILRQYATLVGLQENFTIYDTADSTQAMRRVLAESKVDATRFRPEALRHAISWAKNHLLTVDRYQPRHGVELDLVVQQVYPVYQALLQKANAVDFDDLLLHVAEMLRESPEVRRSLDERYRFVLVDEYQDTNLAQYAIVRALSIDHPNLAVTGDPDQSIYGWRGANMGNILEFDRDFPDAKVVRLEQNYRSTQRILAVAAQLISHNVRRKEKALFTHNGEGRPVRMTRYATQHDEARAIAATIAAELRAGRRRPRDFAIFYRVNALSRAFEFALREEGIPFQLVHGLEFFQRREIKDVLAYVQLAGNPRNEIALLRVINTPARGIGPTTVNRLSAHAAARGMTLLDAARDVANIPAVKSGTAAKVRKFVQMIDHLGSLAGAALEELLGTVVAQSGYRDSLEKSEDPEDEDRLANIEELLTVAREFDERHGGAGALEAFLEETSLVGDTDDWEQSADRATLMTLHAAKGLEFPVVFIVAVEEGILPHERSRDDAGQLEEERRLLFVGITRAQEQLQLSMARYRDFRGARRMTIPSHFLMELPRDEMELDEPGEELYMDAEPPDVEPVFSRSDSAEKTDSGPARRMPLGVTTAANLLNEKGTCDSVSPDTFVQGMLVCHPARGVGRIVALSGSGAGRKATVDFLGGGGQATYLLAKSPLQPVAQKTPRHL